MGGDIPTDFSPTAATTSTLHEIKSNVKCYDRTALGCQIGPPTPGFSIWGEGSLLLAPTPLSHVTCHRSRSRVGQGTAKLEPLYGRLIRHYCQNCQCRWNCRWNCHLAA